MKEFCEGGRCYYATLDEEELRDPERLLGSEWVSQYKEPEVGPSMSQ